MVYNEAKHLEVHVMYLRFVPKDIGIQYLIMNIYNRAYVYHNTN